LNDGRHTLDCDACQDFSHLKSQVDAGRLSNLELDVPCLLFVEAGLFRLERIAADGQIGQRKISFSIRHGADHCAGRAVSSRDLDVWQDSSGGIYDPSYDRGELAESRS